MTLSRRLAKLAEELRRPDAAASEKLLRVAQRGTSSLGLAPHVSVTRRLIVELTTPPKAPRGLSDLVIRRGDERDIDALARIDDTDRELVRTRLRRGELAYVGVADDEILCHTWFHRGPTPFEEDRQACVSWALDGSTFWSYNGAAHARARATGVFAKLFQAALREVFETHGARRVQGFIHDTNRASLAMHDRLGFSVLGSLTAVALPGMKWLRWVDDHGSRQWLLPRASPFAMHLPPL